MMHWGLVASVTILLLLPGCNDENHLTSQDKQALIHKFITEPGSASRRVSMCLKANHPPEELCSQLTAQLAGQILQGKNPDRYDCETVMVAIRRWPVPSPDNISAKCHH